MMGYRWGLGQVLATWSIPELQRNQLSHGFFGLAEHRAGAGGKLSA